MKYILTLCLFSFSLLSFSQSVEGLWNTYDNSSGELKSEVKIYIKDGKLYAKLNKLYNATEAEQNAKCVHCKDYRKDKPIVGMVFISGLTKSGSEWKGNKLVLDPHNGKLYDGKIWLVNDNKLAMRGYLGFLYQTEYWIRK
ncbi:MAG TPA: DUF2147 domain-containing protein [Brumimicrobium sp.]|nr:DUF2147 domain-containing protein [Brumimicrobium sp.]